MNSNYSPLISIVTVVFNAIDTVDLTVKSVLNQTYANVEYVVIDGNSTDGTTELLKGYGGKINKCIIEEDEGIYDAMNKALDVASGDFLLFLGADDLLISPTILAELVPYMTEQDLIYYGNTYIPTSNSLYNGKINKWSIALGNISHQAIFYPKSAYKTKKYDLSYRIFADHIYNIELYALNSSKFQYIPRLISIYSGTGVSSTSVDTKYEKCIIKVITKKFGIRYGIYVWLRRSLYKLMA